jgi:hypothetical protein
MNKSMFLLLIEEKCSIIRIVQDENSPGFMTNMARFHTSTHVIQCMNIRLVEIYPTESLPFLYTALQG